MKLHNWIVGPNPLEAVSAQQLGSRIRKLRQQRGLTLGALADSSGVSRAMLSNLERGENNPTLVVAAKIAVALGVPLSLLLGADEQRTVVKIPRHQQMVFRDPETGFQRQLLSPTFEGKGIELLRAIIPPGSTSGDMPPKRPGVDKYVLVEYGRLRVMVGAQEHTLEEGDSFYFQADVEHRFDNIGDADCSYIAVLTAARR